MFDRNAHRAQNRDWINARTRAWRARRAKDTERDTAYTRASRYGVTPENYTRLLEEQEDGCAICGRPQEDGGEPLHVDHCHRTGRVRGLLCGNCNRAVGLMGDDPARLREAADYLEGKGTVE